MPVVVPAMAVEGVTEGEAEDRPDMEGGGMKAPVDGRWGWEWRGENGG